jgi:exodeoxyribonuclease-3
VEIHGAPRVDGAAYREQNRAVKISTWNVNGIRAREAQLLDFLAAEKPDALCLQEIKASPDDIPPRLVDVADYRCHWHGHKGYSGVGVYLRRSTFPGSLAFHYPDFDLENRVVTVELGEVTLASIYVPNGNKDYDAKVRFLEALGRWVSDAHARGRKLVLCGDLNVALTERDVHPKLRKPEQIGQTPAEQALLAGILDRGLVDLLRHFHPDDDNLFTWWAPWRNQRERNIGWRLDYVLASSALAARATACRAEREVGTSDHGPVTAELDVTFGAAATDEALAATPPASAPPASAPPQLSLFDRDPPRRG